MVRLQRHNNGHGRRTRADALPRGGAGLQLPMPHIDLPVFQGPLPKFELFVTPTLMTRSGVDFAIGCAIWAFTLACTYYTVRSLRSAPASAESGPSSVRHSIESRHYRIERPEGKRYEVWIDGEGVPVRFADISSKETITFNLSECEGASVCRSLNGQSLAKR